MIAAQGVENLHSLAMQCNTQRSNNFFPFHSLVEVPDFEWPLGDQRSNFCHSAERPAERLFISWNVTPLLQDRAGGERLSAFLFFFCACCTPFFPFFLSFYILIINEKVFMSKTTFKILIKFLRFNTPWIQKNLN